jgi:hypothetical protein
MDDLSQKITQGSGNPPKVTYEMVIRTAQGTKQDLVLDAAGKEVGELAPGQPHPLIPKSLDRFAY